MIPTSVIFLSSLTFLANTMLYCLTAQSLLLCAPWQKKSKHFRYTVKEYTIFYYFILQLPRTTTVSEMNVIPPVNKPYVKWVYFDRAKSIFKMLVISWSDNMSTEVLWISVGQKAAKLQAVKFGGLKKILLVGQSRTTRLRPGFESWMIGLSLKLYGP